MFDKKWIKIMALGLSYPSTIFITGLAIRYLVSHDLVSKKIGLILFLIVIFNTLFVMVFWAFRSQGK